MSILSDMFRHLSMTSNASLWIKIKETKYDNAIYIHALILSSSYLTIPKANEVENQQVRIVCGRVKQRVRVHVLWD